MTIPNIATFDHGTNGLYGFSKYDQNRPKTSGRRRPRCEDVPSNRTFRRVSKGGRQWVVFVVFVENAWCLRGWGKTKKVALFGEIYLILTDIYIYISHKLVDIWYIWYILIYHIVHNYRIFRYTPFKTGTLRDTLKYINNFMKQNVNKSYMVGLKDTVHQFGRAPHLKFHVKLDELCCTQSRTRCEF